MSNDGRMINFVMAPWWKTLLHLHKNADYATIGKIPGWCKNTQTNQDLKVCEKLVWTKAERKYSKIKIVVVLEGENCCFYIF